MFLLTLLLTLFLTPLHAQTPPLEPAASTPTVNIPALVQKVLPGINSSLSAGSVPIVRIGVHMDAAGMEDPQKLIQFIKELDSAVSGTVYVVAGPNEPETELWGAPGCSDGQSACIGPKVAAYMNQIIAGKGNTSHIKLLSPVFNLCSPVFPGLISAMSGANFGGLDAIAVNVYNGTPGGADTSTINACLDSRLPLINSNLPVIITETGAFDKNFAAFKSEIQRLGGRVIGALLFNGLNTNPDWRQYSFYDEQIRDLCSGSCSNSKVGVNFATNYTNGDYSRSARLGMRFTLEILSGGGKPRITKLAPDNAKVDISYGRMMGAAAAIGSVTNWLDVYQKSKADSFGQFSREVTKGFGSATQNEDATPKYDKFNEKEFPGSGYIPNEMCIRQKDLKLRISISALNKDQAIKSIQNLIPQSTSLSGKYREINDNVFGPGLTSKTGLPDSKEQEKRSFYDIKFGIAAQSQSQKYMEDDKLKDWLCRLGESHKGGLLTRPAPLKFWETDLRNPVSDVDFSYDPSGSKTAYEICKETLPNGDCDWAKSVTKPLRASSLYCAMGLQNSCSGNQRVDCSATAAIPNGGEFFELFKTRVKVFASLGNNYGSKSFTQFTIEINDPSNNDPPKSCMELANTEVGRGFGLDNIISSEQMSRFMTSVDWGGLSLDDRHYILTAVPKMSGIFFINKPGSCRMAIVYPQIFTNATLGKESSNILMGNMPQSWRENIKPVEGCQDYRNIGTAQLAPNDPLVPVAVINQPNEKEETYRLRPENKVENGGIFASLNWIVNFPKALAECARKSIWITPSGSDPETGKNYDPFQHFFSLCQQDYDIPIEVHTFASQDLAVFAEQTKTASWGLTPENQKRKTDDTYYNNDLRLNQKSSDTCPSEEDFGKADKAGNTGIKCSTSGISNQDDIENLSKTLHKSPNEDMGIRNEFLVPDKWKKEGYLVGQ